MTEYETNYDQTTNNLRTDYEQTTNRLPTYYEQTTNGLRTNLQLDRAQEDLPDALLVVVLQSLAYLIKQPS